MTLCNNFSQGIAHLSYEANGSHPLSPKNNISDSQQSQKTEHILFFPIIMAS